MSVCCITSVAKAHHSYCGMYLSTPLIFCRKKHLLSYDPSHTCTMCQPDNVNFRLKWWYKLNKSTSQLWWTSGLNPIIIRYTSAGNDLGPIQAQARECHSYSLRSHRGILSGCLLWDGQFWLAVCSGMDSSDCLSALGWTVLQSLGQQEQHSLNTAVLVLESCCFCSSPTEKSNSPTWPRWLSADIFSHKSV